MVAPVAYESGCLEEVCGSCTMRINGRVRQACSALVDRLLLDGPTEIELRPMSKFPVVRDLCVDRYRLFRALEKLQCWVPVDGYYDMGSGPKQSSEQQERDYPLSQCMSCGCCLEACPQFNEVVINRHQEESEEAFEKRRDEELDQHFIGAAAMSQAVLMNSSPNGQSLVTRRIEAMIAPGGIQNCGKSGQLPSRMPEKHSANALLGTSQRAATIHVIKKFFDG